jgi:hypothetical protein
MAAGNGLHPIGTITTALLVFSEGANAQSQLEAEEVPLSQEQP